MYSAATDRRTGIICDQTIALHGCYDSRDYPAPLRRIRLADNYAKADTTRLGVMALIWKPVRRPAP